MVSTNSRAAPRGGTAIVLLLALFAAFGGVGRAQETGSIQGRVVDETGMGLTGVAVTVRGTGRSAVTDEDGRFVVTAVPPGTHVLLFTLGEHRETEAGVEVSAGEITTTETTLDWKVSFADQVTVHAASRRMQPIGEAPAAVTVIPGSEVERESGDGQLPKLLEFTPGVEVTQGGLYDFNVNVRGSNDTLTRRVLVLVDGRDVSGILQGNQFWAERSLRLLDVERMELVRGPSSALYGAGAYNGVIDLTTKTPREHRGGAVHLSVGEPETVRGAVRWADELAAGWYGEVTGTYHEGEHLSVSRDPASGGPEYAPCDGSPAEGCVPAEVAPLRRDDVELAFGGLQLQRDLAPGRLLTLEAGASSTAGEVITTGGGRLQNLNLDNRWARLALDTPHWRAFAAYSGEKNPETFFPGTGMAATGGGADRYEAGLQGNMGFGGDRGQLVGGLSYTREETNAVFFFQPIEEDYYGGYSQVDWSFTDRLRGVVALRLDDSTIHDLQVSPRLALVFAPSPVHSLRLTFSRAFQVASYLGLFQEFEVTPPVDLQFAEGICRDAGISCGFQDPVPVVAVGNPELEVETIESFELGYRGTLGRRVFVSVDLYRQELDDFLPNNLLGRFQPELGNISPAFGPYTPPAALPAAESQALLDLLRQALGPAFPLLTNSLEDGSPILAPLSFGNLGEVTNQGVELGVNARITDEWRVDLAYHHLDFEIEPQLEASPIVANAPANQVSVGVLYLGDRFDASLDYRYTEGFSTRGGVWVGRVPSYDVADLSVSYRFDDRWEVGLDVANLFDHRHYQLFGAGLLERRTVARLSYSW